MVSHMHSSRIAQARPGFAGITSSQSSTEPISEKNLPTMLDLKAMFLQIGTPFPIASLALKVLLLLQLEDLRERRLLDMRRHVVFAVEVLISQY